MVLIVLGVVLLITNAIPINVYTSLQYPIAYVPNTEARARAEVRRQAQAGYDLIKVYDYLTRDQYLGVIDEAAASRASISLATSITVLKHRLPPDCGNPLMSMSFSTSI